MTARPQKDRVKIRQSTILSDDWASLTRYTFDYRRSDGRGETLVREVYDRGEAAAVLPYDPDRGTVLLTRQFRLPVWLDAGDSSAWMIEVCAGLLDGDSAEEGIRREALEELGYKIHDLTLACRVHSSPGGIKERISHFLARYSPQDRVSDGGGEPHEGEDIDVLEMPFEEAFAMIASGEIMDAKTVLLLQHLKLQSG